MSRKLPGLQQIGPSPGLIDMHTRRPLQNGRMDPVRMDPVRVTSSEITPEERFVSRRALLAGGLGLAAIQSLGSFAGAAFSQAAPSPQALAFKRNAALSVKEPPNSYQDITTYNNYYEFGTDKSDPAENAQHLRTRPWTVAVGGEAEVTGSFDLDDILRSQPLEERIYRLRCVEAWSMVVPWVGFPLAGLLQRFKPTSKAKYVEFRSLYDPKQMPGQRSGVLEWPYVEGLRIDEAMHPLTLMVVGPLRQGAAEPERGAAAAGRSVEVRLQGNQGDRRHQIRGAHAAHHVGRLQSVGIWLFRQRQPGRRSSALEPGQRNGASAAAASSLRAYRRCPSTATPIRWRACTAGWTCGGISELAVSLGREAAGFRSRASRRPCGSPRARLASRACRSAPIRSSSFCTPRARGH